MTFKQLLLSYLISSIIILSLINFVQEKEQQSLPELFCFLIIININTLISLPPSKSSPSATSSSSSSSSACPFSSPCPCPTPRYHCRRCGSSVVTVILVVVLGSMCFRWVICMVSGWVVDGGMRGGKSESEPR